MKRTYVIVILTILLGFFSGRIFKKENTSLTRSHWEKCDEQESVLKVDSAKKSCPLYIPNAGMLHSRSQTESENKIYDLFNEPLKKFHTEPNEFNVHTNKAPPGISAQKHDPRYELFVRFPIKKASEKVVKVSCPPSFVEISEKDKNKFLGLLKYAKLDDPRDEKDFRFVNFLKNEYFSFREDELILQRYNKLFKNTCSQAYSILSNFCLVDPRYDIQYEDMAPLKGNYLLQSSIYCKKSADKEWTLISEKKYKSI